MHVSIPEMYLAASTGRLKEIAISGTEYRDALLVLLHLWSHLDRQSGLFRVHAEDVSATLGMDRGRFSELVILLERAGAVRRGAFGEDPQNRRRKPLAVADAWLDTVRESEPEPELALAP